MADGNTLQNLCGVINVLISHISLKSIPTWQLKEGPCGNAGNISHAGNKKTQLQHMVRNPELSTWKTSCCMLLEHTD